MSTAFIIGSTSRTYTPAPAGAHVARCVWMIDLGTQTDSFQGREEKARKLILGFELPNEMEHFDDHDGATPYIVSREFRTSLHKKAALRAMLEGWRGRAFTDQEAARFDLSVLIGQPCMVNLIHKTSATGRVRAQIASIARLGKGMECPPASVESRLFSLNDEALDTATFDKLPGWIREKISKSPEYQAALAPNHTPEADIVGSAEDDDIPF